MKDLWRTTIPGDLGLAMVKILLDIPYVILALFFPGGFLFSEKLCEWGGVYLLLCIYVYLSCSFTPFSFFLFYLSFWTIKFILSLLLPSHIICACNCKCVCFFLPLGFADLVSLFIFCTESFHFFVSEFE